MPHRVLVVEDDPEIRETVIEALQEHGYEAEGAADGYEALDWLRARRELPCVILLDLMMPRMDGRSFREAQLREPEYAAIPVVVLSAYSTVAEDAAALNAAAHLEKPLRLSDLVSVASRYCSAGHGS